MTKSRKQRKAPADPKGPTLDMVGRECAALKARMAARGLTRMYDEALRAAGLRITQFTLLVSIEDAEPQSISELADHLAMERTTLTRNLQLMERRGWIEIGPEGYRRTREMTLTKKGRAKLEQALPLWRTAQDRVIASVGNGTWKRTRAVLERLSETS